MAFVFRKNQTVGAASAELDSSFLRQCFIDTGDLAVLRDCSDARRIVVGRTGAGKSALLAQLAEVEDHVLALQPEALALGYITNSGILRSLLHLGTNLDIFFRLLWRHVFVVEILRAKFGIENEASQRKFPDLLWQIVPKNRERERALAYLRNWGQSFWMDTEYRIKEITEKLEREIEASIGVDLPALANLAISGSQIATEEQKIEVIHKAQEVVNRVQIRELSEIIDLLRDVLASNALQRFFITVDHLDEDWIEDAFRFRVIRALITTSLDFARIPNVKVIVGIRQDLLDRVLRGTRAEGFQEEKLTSATLKLSWNREQLTEMLDVRVTALVKDQYTKKGVAHGDLLPSKVEGQMAIDYMIDRTLLRPRDLIEFF